MIDVHRALSDTSIVFPLQYVESSQRRISQRDKRRDHSHPLYLLINEVVDNVPELDQGRCQILPSTRSLRGRMNSYQEERCLTGAAGAKARKYLTFLIANISSVPFAFLNSSFSRRGTLGKMHAASYILVFFRLIGCQPRPLLLRQASQSAVQIADVYVLYTLYMCIDQGAKVLRCFALSRTKWGGGRQTSILSGNDINTLI